MYVLFVGNTNSTGQYLQHSIKLNPESFYRVSLQLFSADRRKQRIQYKYGDSGTFKHNNNSMYEELIKTTLHKSYFFANNKHTNSKLKVRVTLRIN